MQERPAKAHLVTYFSMTIVTFLDNFRHDLKLKPEQAFASDAFW